MLTSSANLYDKANYLNFQFKIFYINPQITSIRCTYCCKSFKLFEILSFMIFRYSMSGDICSTYFVLQIPAPSILQANMPPKTTKLVKLVVNFKPNLAFHEMNPKTNDKNN